MTPLQKRVLLVLALLLLVLLSVLLFGWQITLVLGVVLSIFLSIPLSTLWQGLGQSPSQQEEYPSYTQGYQEVPSYQPPVHQEAPITTEDQPQAQYPQQQYR